MRRLAPLLVAAVVAAIVGLFALAPIGSSAVQTAAVPVPTCTKPTSNVTNVKLADYMQCLSRREEALYANAQQPGPTVTATSTVTVPGPTSTVTQTVTASPTATPTTPTPTEPTPTSPPSSGFPTLQTAGVPAGWTPAATINGDHRVTTAGTVVADLRVNGSLIIDAPNVTVRRVLVVGGTINNWPGQTCRNGLTVEDTTIRRGATTTAAGTPALGDGGYTARNVLIDGTAEGFRVGGKSGGCGPVTITDSYANVVRPDVCGDWHGDGLQGYDGGALTLRNTVLTLDETGCGGTASFFYPNQGNTSVDIDGLIVKGGGYPFRLETPGSVKNLHVVNGSWGYGPLDVTCGLLASWQASVSTIGSNGQPAVVRNLPCA